MDATPKDLAIDILASGFVDSFVDFFYLTHRKKPKPPPPQPLPPQRRESQGGSQTQLNRSRQRRGSKASASSQAEAPEEEEDLEYIKENLTNGETATRQGDPERGFAAYRNLGEHYARRADHPTAAYFHARALDVALGIDDADKLCTAYLDLATVASATGDFAAAVAHLERLLEAADLAAATGGGDLGGGGGGGEVTEAAAAAAAAKLAPKKVAGLKALAEAHKSLGERRLAAGAHAQAAASFAAYREAAAATGDAAREARATYLLGLAYGRLDARRAIDYLDSFSEMSADLGDASGVGDACFALARCHRAAGDLDKAAAFLRRYLARPTPAAADSRGNDNGDGDGDRAQEAEARAASALGEIYALQENNAKAVELYEKNYRVACALDDKAKVDAARIQLGVTRGRLDDAAFMELIDTVNVDDAAVGRKINDLLAWKSTLGPLPQTAVAAPRDDVNIGPKAPQPPLQKRENVTGPLDKETPAAETDKKSFEREEVESERQGEESGESTQGVVAQSNGSNESEGAGANEDDVNVNECRESPKRGGALTLVAEGAPPENETNCVDAEASVPEGGDSSGPKSAETVVLPVREPER